MFGNKRLEKLENRIKELEERIKELEKVFDYKTIGFMGKYPIFKEVPTR